MQIQTSLHDGTIEVRFRDRLSFSDHQAFRELLAEISGSKAKHCVFELSNLLSIDSAGLGMFIIAHEEGKRSGWEFSVEGAHGHIKQLFLLARFDRLLNVKGLDLP